MIDSFKIKANVNRNYLLVELRGYFMKSELELAFYLARKECKKLKQGFEVILDFDGMYSSKELSQSVHINAKKLFSGLGSERVRMVGVLPQMEKYKIHDLNHYSLDSVGFYPN